MDNFFSNLAGLAEVVVGIAMTGYAVLLVFLTPIPEEIPLGIAGVYLISDGAKKI